MLSWWNCIELSGFFVVTSARLSWWMRQIRIGAFKCSMTPSTWVRYFRHGIWLRLLRTYFYLFTPPSDFNSGSFCFVIRYVPVKYTHRVIFTILFRTLSESYFQFKSGEHGTEKIVWATQDIEYNLKSQVVDTEIVPLRNHFIVRIQLLICTTVFKCDKQYSILYEWMKVSFIPFLVPLNLFLPH